MHQEIRRRSFTRNGRVNDAFSEGGRCRQVWGMIGSERLVLGYLFSEVHFVPRGGDSWR